MSRELLAVELEGWPILMFDNEEPPIFETPGRVRCCICIPMVLLPLLLLPVLFMVLLLLFLLSLLLWPPPWFTLILLECEW